MIAGHVCNIGYWNELVQTFLHHPNKAVLQGLNVRVLFSLRVLCNCTLAVRKRPCTCTLKWMLAVVHASGHLGLCGHIILGVAVNHPSISGHPEVRSLSNNVVEMCTRNEMVANRAG